MMSTEAVQLMSKVYRRKVQKRIEAYSTEDPGTGCKIWGRAVTGSGYPTMTLTVRGWNKSKSKNHSVHRLVYVFAGNPEKNKHEMSHLCHRKTCIQLTHLSHEPAFVNMQRNVCKKEKQCFGHGDWGNCISFVE